MSADTNAAHGRRPCFRSFRFIGLGCRSVGEANARSQHTTEDRGVIESRKIHRSRPGRSALSGYQPTLLEIVDHVSAHLAHQISASVAPCSMARPLHTSSLLVKVEHPHIHREVLAGREALGLLGRGLHPIVAHVLPGGTGRGWTGVRVRLYLTAFQPEHHQAITSGLAQRCQARLEVSLNELSPGSRVWLATPLVISATRASSACMR